MSRELQTVNQQNKLVLWAGWITECRKSGQSVRYGVQEMVSASRPITNGRSGFLIGSRRSRRFRLRSDTSADAATVATVLRVLKSC